MFASNIIDRPEEVSEMGTEVTSVEFVNPGDQYRDPSLKNNIVDAGDQAVTDTKISMISIGYATMSSGTWTVPPSLPDPQQSSPQLTPRAYAA